jgi:hypothetical protein
MPGLDSVLFFSVPMFLASVLGLWFIRSRWWRMFVVLLFGFAGFLLFCMGTFGLAMGAGHGSHHGPSAEDLWDTCARAGPVLVVLALGIAWPNLRRPAPPAPESPTLFSTRPRPRQKPPHDPSKY